jgi:hypothetical protein
MHRTRVEMLDESNRKRPAPVEPTDGLDHSKRQRIAVEASSRPLIIPPLPSGPVSWRQLYTLNPEGSTVNFDVQAFKEPERLLGILLPVLQSVDAMKLDQAINVREPSSLLVAPIRRRVMEVRRSCLVRRQVTCMRIDHMHPCLPLLTNNSLGCSL